MENFDKKVDAYVAKSATFAQPILEHLRELVHKACPEVTETIKWGFPNFEYKGLICNMAAFKAHCTFGFWKGKLMTDPHNVMSIDEKSSHGNFNRITSVEDLPADKIMLQYIREAVKLNEENIKKAPVKKTATPVKVPAYFTNALKKNKKAQETFTAFSPSNRKEYIEWISEAKTEETRQKRIATALEWLSEGKSRHWKYKK